MRRLQGAGARVEYRPRFQEMILERGDRGSRNKIAVISLRGLISSGVPGNVGESMVDDLRWELEQARKDDNVRAVVLEVDSPGGEVTASDMIYQCGGEDPGDESRWSSTWNRSPLPAAITFPAAANI